VTKETETSAAAAAKAGEAPWRHYPHLDAAIETDAPALLASLENTQAETERLSRTGTERERERARAALVACGRALALYRHLVDLRDEALRTGSNMRGGAAITQ
jgi:hypothetical protein